MSRLECWDALTAFVRAAEDLLATKTTGQWLAAFRAGGVPCGPFNFPNEVFDDPQVAANGYLVELDHPILGPYKTFAPPIRMDRTPTAIHASSPLLDADTDAVLAEAGLSAEDIGRMRSTGVVGRR